MRRFTIVFKVLMFEFLILSWSHSSEAAPTDLGPNEVLELLHKSTLLYQAGKYEMAEPLVQRACLIMESDFGGQSAQFANCLNNLGLLHMKQGEYRKAKPLLIQALDLLEEAQFGDHPSRITILNNLGSLYQAQGEYSNAYRSYERALSISEQTLGNKHPLIANCLNNLGLLNKEQGEYEMAEQRYKRALAIHEQALGSRHPSVAISLNNLGALYQARGEYGKAESQLERALVIYEEALGREHPDVARCLSNLGLLYAEQGEYDMAESRLKRALAISEQALGNNHPFVATCLNNLGLLYQEQGEYDKATLLHERALYINEQALGRNHLLVAGSLNNLGMLHETYGEYRKSKSLLERALAIAEQNLGQNHPLVARSLNNLGLVYQAQREHKKAKRSYQRALSISEQLPGGKHLDVAKILINLGTLELDFGRHEVALELYRRAFDIEEKNLTRTLVVADDSRRLTYASTLLGSLYIALSVHLQAAPDHLPAAELALTTLLQRKGRSQDLSAQSYANLRRSLPVEHQHLLGHLALVRRRYSALTHYGPTKGAEERFVGQLDALQQDQDRVWSKLVQVSPEVNALTAPATIEDIQQALPCRSALVELVQYVPLHNDDGVFEPGVGAPRYAAYLVLPHRVDWVDLGPAEVIDDLVATFREHLARPVEGIEEHARALYVLVMEPVVERLGKSRQLFIAPDTQLYLIPFGALHDGKRYLIESYALRYLTTGRDLLRPRDAGTQTQDSVLAVANPKGADLAGTESEVDFLEKLFHGSFEKLVGAQATETHVLEHTRPRMLHLGTHGFFDTQRHGRDFGNASVRGLRTWSEEQTPIVRLDNPMLRSGLVLAETEDTPSGGRTDDGRLTAYEVSGWDLRGTQLVTLSACETALGELKLGEGVLGLRRAFVLAGAQTQVMSLWKISDTATPAVMESFYRRLEKGEGRGEAMQNAQLEILRSRTHSHPFYWAAFVVSGEWRPLSRPGEPEPPPLSRCGCRASIGGPSDGYAGMFLLLLLLAHRRRPVRCGRETRRTR